MYLFLETVGTSQLQVSKDNSDEAIMRDIARTEGQTGVIKYIKNNINRWKNKPLKCGIVGRAATGKSSFVNLVRNVKEGDEGYAQVGHGLTTTAPTPYVHPDNKQIVYWDLPGFGTMMFPKCKYIDQMRLQKYDYFLVFFYGTLQEDDLWIVDQLDKLKKKFCLVYTHVDLEVRRGVAQGIDQKTVLTNLRTKQLISFNRYINLKALYRFFVISCKERGVGEIDILFQHIKENVFSIKFEAVLSSLDNLSQELIDERYQILKSRVLKASVGTAMISASHIPVIDNYANISILVNEIKQYIEAFGITSKQIINLGYRDQMQLRCRDFFGLKSEKRLREIVKRLFIQKYEFPKTSLSIPDKILPIVGSVFTAASTGTKVKTFLYDILENFKQDSTFLYDMILPLPVRIIRTLRVYFENEGQECIYKYICDVLNRWKEEIVTLGFIGEPDSGKIEFINRIRRLKIRNSGFAEENKTTSPYFHPNNEGIVFVDAGISDSREMQISCMDYFFVFLNNDIYTDDIRILQELIKIERSFSVIRTKSSPRAQDPETILGSSIAWLRLETDLECVEKLVEVDEELDSERLRDIIHSYMYKDNDDKYDIHQNACVLSCLNIGLGELDKLISHMIQNLPSAKSEAVLNALHPLSKLVIEEKFQSLKNRIVFVTIAATLTRAFQIPNICFPVNMHILVDEITHYIQVLGFLDTDEEPRGKMNAEVYKLRCRDFLKPDVVFSNVINRQLKVLSTDDSITAIQNVAELFVPVAGSLVSTANNAAIVYKYLTGVLGDFRHDAFVVYDSL